jgi:hypothetical protein
MPQSAVKRTLEHLARPRHPPMSSQTISIEQLFSPDRSYSSQVHRTPLGA